MKKVLMVMAAIMVSGVAANAEYVERHPIEPQLHEVTVLIETCHTMNDGGPMICFDDAGRTMWVNYVGGEGPEPPRPGNNTRNGYDNHK